MQRIARGISPSSSSLLSNSTRAVAETPNLVRGSSIQCHTSSVAACVSTPDTSQVKRPRRKVSKDERKSMAESYVNEYRAMNSGKFPTTRDVLKEVGGSYYTVRKIVQELQYESQMPSTSTKDRSLLGKEVRKENELSNDLVEVLSSQMVGDDEIGDDAEVGRLLEERESCRYSPLTTAEQLIGNEQKIRVRITDETQKRNEGQSKEERAKDGELTEVDEISIGQRILDAYSHKDTAPSTLSMGLTEEAKSENMSTQVETVLGGQMACAGVDSDTQTSSELEKCTREPSKEQTDEEHQKTSSTWERLKSLAEGIISIWKKL